MTKIRGIRKFCFLFFIFGIFPGCNSNSNSEISAPDSSSNSVVKNFAESLNPQLASQLAGSTIQPAGNWQIQYWMLDSGGNSYPVPIAVGNTQGPTIIDIANFGAVCDGVTPDTAAFQSAAKFAGSWYQASKLPTTINISTGKEGVCVIDSTVYVPSGTHFVGAGGVVQAVGSMGAVFESDGGSNIGYDQMQITASTANVNVGIYYITSSANTNGPYQNFSLTNSVIHGAAYAVIVNVYEYPDGLSRKLTNVNISNNTVFCDLINGGFDTKCRDGIHISGEVADVEITSNLVKQRNDAAYALTSDGTPDLETSIATFGSLLPGLTPTNVTISNNIGTDDQTCLDFSGGNNVVANNNQCVDTIPISGSGPSMRFVFGGYLPLPSNITVNGGTFSNVIGPEAVDPSNVKMSFDSFAVNGQYPVCNCSISNVTLGGYIYMLGNTFAFNNVTFNQSASFVVATENEDTTNAITVSNSNWGSPRTISPTNINGGISNSYLINDTYNGKTTAKKAIQFPWVEN